MNAFEQAVLGLLLLQTALLVRINPFRPLRCLRSIQRIQRQSRGQYETLVSQRQTRCRGVLLLLWTKYPLVLVSQIPLLQNGYFRIHRALYMGELCE